ncbi:type 1 periplasmic binding fold superfamily protein [Muriicola soli]|uniref:Type 1 periplasmic binding fold superfamily protein n=1 Tax=Muriicola soli TaxID=2507538 RepID=A0A411E7H4_9FLAO|nr:type 1 periplasmic binding fold superfamily protein [Muriicola soli]QBA63440.1 type 1 periplasmic binding fold superfamily protein [Muriicola soli]
MKTVKILTLLMLGGTLLTSCSDDDPAPEPINEEEIITTLTVTLTPDGGGTTVTLQSQDLDGDGPNAPVVTVSGDLVAGTTYNGGIVVLNETETPAENITEEVEEEDDEHQFFYTVGGGLDVTTEYANFDGNGNPLGTEFTLISGAASSGTLAFTLRHEPTKPNTGLADAGGETDIAVTFNVTVQ